MGAQEFSFDVVSRVNDMEVKNALLQAHRELAGRYDFKGSKCEIVETKEDTTLVADDEFKMEQLKDIVVSKLLKRGIDIRSIDWGKIEHGTGLTLRQKLLFKVGIPQDKARELIKIIKDKGLKVQAQMQGDQVRVSAKVKDDLQKTITLIKSLELTYPVEFTNYR
jgi:hypothetical protein